MTGLSIQLVPKQENPNGVKKDDFYWDDFQYKIKWKKN